MKRNFLFSLMILASTLPMLSARFSVVGSGESMGYWNKDLGAVMNNMGSGIWQATVAMSVDDEFKIVELDSDSWYGAEADGSYWIGDEMIFGATPITLEKDKPNLNMRASGTWVLTLDVSNSSKPTLTITSQNYAITLVQPEGGSFTSNLSSARWGETVAMAGTADDSDSYHIAYSILRTEDGVDTGIFVVNSTFNMPNYPVTVVGRTIPRYALVGLHNQWDYDDGVALLKDSDGFSATVYLEEDAEMKVVSTDSHGGSTWWGAEPPAGWTGDVEITKTMIQNTTPLQLLSSSSATNFTCKYEGNFKISFDALQKQVTMRTTSNEVTLASNAHLLQFTATPTPATWDDEVAIIAIPAAGYEVTDYRVTKTSNGRRADIDVVNNRFFMPPYGVTITPTVEESFYYLVGDFNNWEASDDNKLIMGDDGLCRITAAVGDQQEFKIKNNRDEYFTAVNTTVSDDLVKAATGIEIKVKGGVNNNLKLATPGTREFILSPRTMTLTIRGLEHDVIVAEVDHGSSVAAPTSARWGETITVTSTADNGYELTALQVLDDNNNVVSLVDNTFEMPDCDANVIPTFDIIRSGMCGSNLFWIVNEQDNSLSISGQGEMYSYDDPHDTPWHLFNATITSLSLEDGITTIGDNAFCNMSNLSDNVNIPEGVTSLGFGCFSGTGISAVNLPSTITTIRAEAFKDAANLNGINLEDCTSPDFTQIAYNTFAGTSLASIVIPANISYIGDYAFGYNNILSDVTLLCSTVLELGEAPFDGVAAMLYIDDADVYNEIATVGEHWGGALQFTIVPLEENAFRYATIVGIEGGYLYTGSPIDLPTPTVMMGTETLSTDQYTLAIFDSDNNEVSTVIEKGQYYYVATATQSSGYTGTTRFPFVVTDEGVTYIDAQQNECIRALGSYTVLDNSITTWKSGWYVLDSDITISTRIEVDGDDVNIILEDGYTLTAGQGIHASDLKGLTIYGQTANSGNLIAHGYDGGAGIGGNRHETGATLTINGGTIEATSSDGSAAIGGGDQGYWMGSFGACGSVTINGGSVSAISYGHGAGIGGGGYNNSSASGMIGGNGGIVTINGGQVDANSQSGYGIGPGKIDGGGSDGALGTVLLGWRDADDYISVSSIAGDITFVKGFSLDGRHIAATADNIDNNTLVPAHVVIFDDEMEHGTVEADKTACPLGEIVTVTLTPIPDAGYTFGSLQLTSGNEVPYRDNGDGTFSFDMSAADVIVSATFVSDTIIKGDLNGDGVVDGTDISAILELVLDGGDITPEQLAAGDFDGSGTIDSADVSALIELALSGD